MMKTEPLTYFFRNAKLIPSEVEKFVCGEKFFALMLTDGRIGVCSTLGIAADVSILNGNRNFNLSDDRQRIVINAWLNAKMNYDNDYRSRSDIFDRIDFRRYNRIVMIGYFESLYEKFAGRSISIEIFDREISNNHTSPISNLEAAVRKADSLILSGTTIFNRSFLKLVSLTSAKCDVYLLGPSNILSNGMFQYRNVKMVFGSVFRNRDTDLLEKIREGNGAKHFLKEENKVYIMAEDFVLK
jgi:uncharacterized protein (DUF4213/DUF364 family)